jgi:hypothetical protein
MHIWIMWLNTINKIMSITGKGEAVPIHTTVAYMGGQGTSPLSPYLGSRWEWSTSSSSNFTPHYALNRRLSGLHSWIGCYEEKHLLPLPGIKPWTFQSTAQSLYRLLYPIHIQCLCQLFDLPMGIACWDRYSTVGLSIQYHEFIYCI